MKKEILKAFMMVLLIVVMALANAAVSNAQPAKQIVAAIPFEFSVDYKTMPAGTYVFQTVATAGDALLIQNVDGTTSALRQADAIESIEKKSTARLVFHRYGERYFLAEVWNGSANGDRGGRRLMKSEAERAFERELASLSSKSELAQSSYEAIEVIASLR